MISDGQYQSFQAVENTKIASVAKIGTESGNAMRQNNRISDAPSIRPDSNSSHVDAVEERF